MGFVFNKEVDNKENIFVKCFSNIETNAVVSINGKNIVVKGNPKISARIGNSKFGNELLFEFLIKEKISEYDSHSTYKSLEYYLPLEEGIKFLEESLLFLKNELKNKNENS
jgi:hypothetical protein